MRLAENSAMALGGAPCYLGVSSGVSAVCQSCDELMSRRSLMRAVGGLGVVSAAGEAMAAEPPTPPPGPRSLWLRSVVTLEEFQGVYHDGARYLPQPWGRVDHLLRDNSTQEETPTDPRLLNLLNHLQRVIGPGQPILIVDGFRSPETNTARRRTSQEIDPRSLHMMGMAADILVSGMSVPALAGIVETSRIGARRVNAGGRSLHVDAGPIRGVIAKC